MSTTTTPPRLDDDRDLERPVGPGEFAESPATAPAARRSLVLSGGLWSAASQVIPAFGTAVLSVAAGRYLGSGPLGQQSLIAYVNAAIAAVVVMALNTAVLQVGGRLQGQADLVAVRRLVRWAIGAHLLAGAVVLAAMTAAGLVNGTYRSAWIVLGAVSVLDAAADALAIRLVLREGWGPIGRLRLAFQMTGPLFGIALIFAGLGVTGIFVGDGIAALGLLVAVVPRYLRLGAESAEGATRRLPVFGPPVPVLRLFLLFAIAAVITQVVSKRIEFVVLDVFRSDSDVGMYSVAFMVVNLVSLVPYGVAAAAMPVVAAAEGRGESGAAVRHLHLALRVGTLICLPTTALLATLGPEAVIVVYGTRYEDAARLVPYASLALIVAVITGLATQFWSGQGRLRIVLGTGAVAAVVDLGVALALVPSLGATGAVVANLSGQLALALGLVLATVRATGPIGWSPRGVFWSLVVAVDTAGAVLLTRWVVDRWLPGTGSWHALLVLGVSGVAGLVALAATARVCGMFVPDEAEWAGPLLPGRFAPVVRNLTIAAPTSGTDRG